MPLYRRIGRGGLIGAAARTAVVAGTATAVTGGMARRQQRRAYEQQEAYAAQQAAVAPVAQAPAAQDPVETQLQQLAQLHAQGILTDEEFAAAKAKALGI